MLSESAAYQRRIQTDAARRLPSWSCTDKPGLVDLAYAHGAPDNIACVGRRRRRRVGPGVCSMTSSVSCGGVHHGWYLR